MFAGLIGGFACVALGLLVFVANPDPAPQASRDPVARFDLDIVSPLVVIVDPPFYQPIRDRMEQVGLFAVSEAGPPGAWPEFTETTHGSICLSQGPTSPSTPKRFQIP
jgi:hypothetical protein